MSPSWGIRASMIRPSWSQVSMAIFGVSRRTLTMRRTCWTTTETMRPPMRRLESQSIGQTPWSFAPGCCWCAVPDSLLCDCSRRWTMDRQLRWFGGGGGAAAVGDCNERQLWQPLCWWTCHLSISSDCWGRCICVLERDMEIVVYKCIELCVSLVTIARIVFTFTWESDDSRCFFLLLLFYDIHMTFTIVCLPTDRKRPATTTHLTSRCCRILNGHISAHAKSWYKIYRSSIAYILYIPYTYMHICYWTLCDIKTMCASHQPHVVRRRPPETGEL